MYLQFCVTIYFCVYVHMYIHTVYGATGTYVGMCIGGFRYTSLTIAYTCNNYLPISKYKFTFIILMLTESYVPGHSPY